MKNNKIIFLVAIVCCLAVSWLCFGAWTIADTSYQVSDFQYSTSTAYLYIVPSSNIPASEYSNVLIYGNYKRSTSSNMYSLHNGTFSSMTRSDLGFRYSSSSSLVEGVAVHFYVNVSSYNTSIGNYVITGAYYITSNLTFDNLWKQSNYISDELSASDFRTIIVFVDKLPTVSGGVSQEQYDELLADYEQAVQEKLEYQQGYVELRSDYDELETRYTMLQQTYDQVSQQLAQAEQNYSQLQSDYNTLQTSYNQVVNDRNSWENYAHGIEEQLDELTESNARLQRDYDNLLREYNIIISENESIGFVERAFLAVGNILEIEILPNITIGTIVSVPLILGVVFLVLRLVRGE